MKHWYLYVAIGTFLSTSSYAFMDENRYQDSRAQRYYQQNRQYYDNDDRRPVRRFHLFGGWGRSDNYNDNNNNYNDGYASQREHHMWRHRHMGHQGHVNTEVRSNAHYAPHMMPDRMSTNEKTFVFSMGELTWAAYDSSGNLIRKGHGSAGRGYCPDIGRGCHTPTGSFRVQSKRGPDCKSSIYPRPNGGAKMPYCMFFHKSYAIHGSYDVPDYNASHGCVRVYPQDAQWLNSSFMSIGTKVIIRN